MRTLLDIVRSLILLDPVKFSRELVESSVSRCVFHDVLLRAHLPLSFVVSAWLAHGKNTKKLDGISVLRLSHTLNFDDRVFFLFQDATRMVLEDCTYSTPVVMDKLEHAEFTNVDFKDPLGPSPLISLRVRNKHPFSNFFTAFAHCPLVFARLTHLAIVEEDGEYCTYQYRLRISFFETLLKCPADFRLESADIQMNHTGYIMCALIVRFLHDKCSVTLRSLKMQHLYLSLDYVFPALEHMHLVDGINDWSPCRSNMRERFPKLGTLRIQRARFTTNPAPLCDVFSHVADIEVLE